MASNCASTSSRARAVAGNRRVGELVHCGTSWCPGAGRRQQCGVDVIPTWHDQTGGMATDAGPIGAGGSSCPRVDEESEGFWEGTARGELRLQACGSCGILRFPPRVMCPHCQSTGAPLAAGVGHRNDLVVRGLSSAAPSGLRPVCSVPCDHGDVGRGAGVTHGGESGHRAGRRNQRDRSGHDRHR